MQPNGERYPLVGGTRRGWGAEKTQSQDKAQKRAESHLSAARCVGQFCLLQCSITKIHQFGL